MTWSSYLVLMLISADGKHLRTAVNSEQRADCEDPADASSTESTSYSHEYDTQKFKFLKIIQDRTDSGREKFGYEDAVRTSHTLHHCPGDTTAVNIVQVTPLR
jgi:hypothetical protein